MQDCLRGFLPLDPPNRVSAIFNENERITMFLRIGECKPEAIWYQGSKYLLTQTSKYFVYERERKMVKLSTLCYIEQDGKYLMLHRTVKENDINKDKWIGVGGHFEKGESPEECLLREVWEETGYTLTSWRYRGIVTFVYGEDVVEYMSLYTADGFTGTPIACDEGELEWVEKSKIGELELWEGDRIFFELLENEQPFFSLKLVYNTDDVLEYAALDGKEMKDFRRREC